MGLSPCGLALARLVARVRLVDDVDPALAPHNAAVLVALLERFQGIYVGWKLAKVL